MRAHLEKFLRLQFTVPLLIVAAVSLSLISEMTYMRTMTTLERGIALTDARISSARLLQLLTDAETAQRGYLLTGNADYLVPLRNAQREFESSVRFLEFLGGIGESGREDAKRIYAAAAGKFAELDRTIAMADAGDRIGALALVNFGEGKRLMDSLRVMFESKFKQAELLHEHARDVIYNALWFNRTAVAVLSWLVAIGLYLHMRQSKSLDRARKEHQQTLEKEVSEQTLELRTLAGYLQSVREDEKAHLARELHDELGSLLSAAKMTLARIRAKLSHDPEMLERIQYMYQYLNEGIALKRRIIEDLRPSTLSVLGLNVALDNFCNDVQKQMGIAINTDIAQVKLDPDVELGIFRIVQEALTNIGKYAKATEASVRLQDSGEELMLEVADNGVGFDVATLQAGQHGLAGMRFRVQSLSGTLSITSQKGQGTRIVVKLPRQAPASPVLAELRPLAAAA
jgi:signal transduction histidine kinase